MAFWGVEVKPGKPFTHRAENTKGRLHISQATLGIGSAKNRSIVQCNVGSKSPVFLCSLFPENAESCQLNLEFDEVDEVVFSVIGPRSVHLTGYYVGEAKQYSLQDDSESFGEDIVDTETERSERSSDNEYGGSFIDDDTTDAFLESPMFNAFEDTEDTDDTSTPKKQKENRKRHKKKYQVSDSDEDNEVQKQLSTNKDTVMEEVDSENEDNLPITQLSKNLDSVKDAKLVTREIETDGVCNNKTSSEISVEAEPKRDPENVVSLKKKKKKVQSSKGNSNIVEDDDKTHQDVEKGDDSCQGLQEREGSDNGTKKKKKGRKLKEEQVLDANFVNSNDNAIAVGVKDDSRLKDHPETTEQDDVVKTDDSCQGLQEGEGPDNGMKKKKGKKFKEEQVLEANFVNSNDNAIAVTVKDDSRSKDDPETTEQDDVEKADDSCQGLQEGEGPDNVTKKKKKGKKLKEEQVSDANFVNSNDNAIAVGVKDVGRLKYHPETTEQDDVEKADDSCQGLQEGEGLENEAKKKKKGKKRKDEHVLEANLLDSNDNDIAVGVKDDSHFKDHTETTEQEENQPNNLEDNMAHISAPSSTQVNPEKGVKLKRKKRKDRVDDNSLSLGGELIEDLDLKQTDDKRFDADSIQLAAETELGESKKKKKKRAKTQKDETEN